MVASYDLILTAVSERADLFAEGIRSLLDHIDCPPGRIFVHEDVKPGSRPGAIEAALDAVRRSLPMQHAALIVTNPARGLGPAVHRLLSLELSPIVFYSQEDWRVLRTIPVVAALALMERHGLNHLAFLKRTVPASKHPGQPDEWRKIEKTFDGQTLTLAQVWRAQASLWRVAAIAPFFEHLVRADPEPDRWGMVKVNRMFNLALLGDEHGNDHAARAARARTWIWGGIGEPAFIEHTGGDRRAEADSIARYGAAG